MFKRQLFGPNLGVFQMEGSEPFKMTPKMKLQNCESSRRNNGFLKMPPPPKKCLSK